MGGRAGAGFDSSVALMRGGEGVSLSRGLSLVHDSSAKRRRREKNPTLPSSLASRLISHSCNKCHPKDKVGVDGWLARAPSAVLPRPLCFHLICRFSKGPIKPKQPKASVCARKKSSWLYFYLSKSILLLMGSF